MSKTKSYILELIIYPSVISANRNAELTVLAQALQSPLIVPKNAPIAKAIALPSNTIKRVTPIVSQQVSSKSKNIKTTNNLQFNT